jgi:dienelactone hydrolase
MAEVLLFHHAQGLTSGVLAFADEIRRAGHAVHTPDLFGGRVFATLDEGLAHAREVGFDRLREDGVRAADGLPADLVHAGFSLGGMPAQQLAQGRPGRGALVFHRRAPPGAFGSAWPADLPVQIHAMDADPFFVEDGGDLDAARAIVDAADDGELFLYPGDQHLFTDSSLPAHDPAATALVLRRTLEFLARR